MNPDTHERAGKPPAVTTVQILLYLSCVVNVVNGLLSWGSGTMEKKLLSLAMILFGIASVWVAVRLRTPKAEHRRLAIGFSIALLAFRIVEYTVWHSYGFVLGMLLPVLILWRLNSSEAKAWFGVR